jgi:hypothetical protein
VGNVQQGIFIRFLDKVSRLSTYMTKGKFEVNESLQDTIVDAINYFGSSKGVGYSRRVQVVE